MTRSIRTPWRDLDALPFSSTRRRVRQQISSLHNTETLGKVAAAAASQVNSTHCSGIPKLVRGFVVGPRFLSKSLQSQPPVGHKACMLHTVFASPWSGRWRQIINVSPSQDHLQLPPVPASSSVLATLEGTSDEHKVGAKIFRNAELVFRFNVRVCQIG